MKNTQLIRYRSLIFLLLLLYGCIAMAQSKQNTKTPNDEDQHQVMGEVVDTNGMPVPGVHVLIKDTQNGTFTDDNGVFTIAASPSDVLMISYVGFQTTEIPVGSDTELSVVLKEDITDLGAVTVNAGYYTVSEKERTGSISKITAVDIDKQPVTEVLATMQGRMPGVFVTQTSGVPGGAFQIQIRGQNSLRADGNNPLYIIDGVPYSSETVGSSHTTNPIPLQLSPLNSIDPSSIASIEVLKDADATAIYGSRGANGVVLITTKRGTVGKTRFDIGYSYGTGRVDKFMDLMDTKEYLEMRKEAYANDGITDYPANAYDINGVWDQDRYTDWQEVLIGGTSEFTDINGSISGGSEQTQFGLSGNYHKETTVYPGDYAYHKVGVHTSLNHMTSDEKFRLQFSTSYTLQDNNLPGNSFVSKIYELPPNAPALYNKDGSLNWENSTWVNPLSVLETNYESNSYDLVSNIMLTYEFFPGLDIKTSLGYTNTRFDNQYELPYTYYDPAYELTSEYSSIRKNLVHRKSWILEPQLSYVMNIKDLEMRLLFGSTFQKQVSSQLVQGGYGYASDAFIENLSAASTKYIFTDDQTQYKYNAVFGRLNLNYKERYIINLTGRRDGSSRFGPGKQFANFGAIGGAWLFSEEPWIKEHIGLLSFGKIRGSYGITGSDQIGDYQYLDTYALNGNTYGGIAVMEPSRLFNPLFSWEENKKLELALETGFFQDRIFLTAAWYRNRSSNQLVGIPLPGTTGFPSIQANLDATVENRGWEFSLLTENFRNSGFNWSTSFNISINRNELISFPDLEGSTYANSYVIGEPLNIKKVYQYEGLDTQTGLYKFKDFNGDGLVTLAGDREAIKDINPSFFGGLQNSIRYKGFSLDVLFQFVKQDNYLGYQGIGTPGGMRNHLVKVRDRWQHPGDRAAYQAYTSGASSALNSSHHNYTQSNAVIGDVSYIKLKNISLSYALPKEILKEIGCVFILRGQNLLTFTKYEGLDPESVFSNKLPALSVLTTGVQLNF